MIFNDRIDSLFDYNHLLVKFNAIHDGILS